MSETVRTERGWPAHFICASKCSFRRNTLLSRGKKKIIVSTVGCYRNPSDEIDTIGAFGRYYETMVFEAHKEGDYWEANVGKQLSFDSEWAICYETKEKIPQDVDIKADEMHEAVVAEFINKKRWP